MMRLIEEIRDNKNIQRIVALKRRQKLYLVGGTIRDLLLGIKPNDYDFAVSGSGINFARRVAKTVRGAFVLLSEEDDEARVVKDDVIYDFIGYKNDIIHDLKRRDFTINAMAVDLDTFEFLDPDSGLKDLKRKIIRPTTENSLKDDPLRVLRGFRFALELNFEIDKIFYKLAKEVSLNKIAPERIGYEFIRIILVPNSYNMILKMDELGLFVQIFPEAKKIIEDKVFWKHALNTYHTLEILMEEGFFKNLEPEFSNYFSLDKRKALLKIAGLFHDIAKPDTRLMKEGDVHFYGHDTRGAKIVEMICFKRLKLSRNDSQVIKKLVKEHMRPHLLAANQELTDRAIRRFFRDLGEDYFGAMMLAWADGYATGGRTRHLEKTFLRMIELKRADESKPKVERLVNGYDLIAIGLKPGPIFKVILQELLDLQLEGKIKTKEEGLKIAKEIYEKEKDSQPNKDNKTHTD
ncbi:MAG: HD domain-containing protein [candidate division WOR-3 bacterium]|nr:HD domain-containing protein [candidate division WOR-3 bacterium]